MSQYFNDHADYEPPEWEHGKACPCGHNDNPNNPETPISHSEAQIKRVMESYDANHDIIPGAPDVTYTDWVALNVIKDLLGQINILEERVNRLENPEVERPGRDY